MSLLSVAARNASLAMSYGAARGSSAPASLEVALFVGDPANGGTELAADGGYAPVTVANDATTWPDAPADGAITASPVAFADSTGAWSDVATHFLLRNAATGDAWDSGRLAEPDGLSVTEAGTTDISIAPTVFYNDEGAL